MCDTAYLFRFDDPDGESAQPGDIFRAVTGTDSTPVFIVVPVDDIMTTILNRPMAAVNLEDTLWAGLVCRSTGDAVSHFRRSLATLFVDEFPFDGKRLSNTGKVKVVVEFGGSPNLSDFDSSMIRGRILNEIRLFAILKPSDDVFEDAALVSFDGEMIMSMALRDQVLGNLALSQQRIGGHLLALNLDGVKHGDGHLDFIGAFKFFVIVYRQGPHFFWV